jgi:tetratricopeptide (TPR) repeat protein
VQAWDTAIWFGLRYDVPVGSSDTLRSIIDAGRSNKRLDELSSARVIGKIALQIHAAQQKAGAGKAVGPITPAHIKLLPSGEAKLELSGGSALGYSSPEQASGGPGDRRSDVFSLGAVLWEALTYQRLFDAMNDAAVRVAVQEREIQPPADVNANVPAELSAICMRALSRNPADRYQSLKAMAVEIEEFLEEAGYEDNDTKIASYLAALREPPQQVKITMPPLARPASSTQPPPVDKQAAGTQPPPNVLKPPAAPAMLGDSPKLEPRPKSPSGAALAAALANAGASTANGSSSASATSGLAQARAAVTAVGVPPAPVEPANVANPLAGPATPLAPVLPGSSAAARADKGTIAVAVPPPVNATIEAKHVEAKQPALIVEDKPKAEIVDDKPKAEIVEPKPKAEVVEAKQPALIVEDKPKAEIVADKPKADGADDKRAALVDSKPPEVEAPKLVDGKLPEAASIAASTANADAAKRAPSHSDATRRAPSHADGSSPHPAAAVALGPIPGGKDSKDVLAGWGWGTDKHTAIPDGYGDDVYDVPAPDSKKTLTYVIGGGLALAALVTIIAVAFGGSGGHKKDTKAVAKQADTSRTVVDPPATAPTPDPTQSAALGSSAQAAASPADPAQTSPADPAQTPPADPAQPQADPAAAAQLAEQEAAKAEAAKAEQAKAEAEAAKLAAQQAEQAKAEAAKAEAARIAAEKKAEAARIAEAKKAEQARIAEAKKAEAARIAAEKKAEAAGIAEAKRAEAAKRAASAKSTKSTQAKKSETVKVATADTPKVDVETAYRQGLQQFARGDTSGALASLRTSLAANPNYAPTWRGLGLVFEKMGEKDQARAAYKRYLQLAPTAGDADQIRGRLERLGS